jgi:hypothetical protein
MLAYRTLPSTRMRLEVSISCNEPRDGTWTPNSAVTCALSAGVGLSKSIQQDFEPCEADSLERIVCLCSMRLHQRQRNGVLRRIMAWMCRYREHVEAIHGYPTRAVDLLEKSSCGKSGGAIESAGIVRTEKAAFEQVVALGVLAIDPPREAD